MTTAVVLFTRDLRVHDNPALRAACRRADRVVPLFVLDEVILDAPSVSPNRVSHLLDALGDLRAGLRARGGELLIRRGSLVEQVRQVAVQVGADELHLAADVSAYARRRERELAAMARTELGGRLRIRSHEGITAVAPDALVPSGGDHFRVFTPYWRRWSQAPRRDPEPAPARVPTPDHLDAGEIPALDELVSGTVAPELSSRGGEVAARARAEHWLAGPIERYAEARDLLAEPGTSRLSEHLHLGTLSVVELIARLDIRRPGHESFLQELCWRDFNHQLLAARPDLVRTDVRTQNDRWLDEADAIAAWREGRTGYPVVDAGMRQLLREGWMHNRARMIVASFLTKHLYVDWRVGAAHFMHHLVDGDVANNHAQWQWVAGTGTDTRPNRMFNPVLQGQRYDPDGVYVRRYVPELAEVSGGAVHEPWQLAGSLFAAAPGYPPPIVDHREARDRFLTARGR